MQNTEPLPASPSSRPSYRWRVVTTLGCAALLLITAGATFWFQDARYALPTPKPPALQNVALGETVSLPQNPPFSTDDRRPLFLHFFNPECPCSRFNAAHVRALRAHFGTQARFVAIVQTTAEQDPAQRQASLAAVGKLFGPGMEAVVDDDGRIAVACGVYSTPQAVILAAGSPRALLFRGNYNSSRYCADPQTEFARLALTAVVNHQTLPPESLAAMVAYGCELPANVAATKAKPAGRKL